MRGAEYMKDNKDMFWNGDSDKLPANNNDENIDVDSTMRESTESSREDMFEEKSIFINKFCIYSIK